MRKVYAWLACATLFSLVSTASAGNDVLKPYVVLILDTSGSMNVATGAGPTSCGKKDSRLNHAVCAINSIVNSYGDMVFSFARFREDTNIAGTMGTPGSQVCDTDGNQEGNVNQTLPPTGGDVCNTQGAYCGDCNPATGNTNTCTSNAQCTGTTCLTITGESGSQCTNNTDDDGDNRINDGCAAVGPAESGANCFDNIDNDSDGTINDGCAAQGVCSGGCTTADRNFEVLTPLVDGNNATAARYTDGGCNTCQVKGVPSNHDPEIWGVGQNTFTPLAATLAGAKKYWQGLQASDGTQIWEQTLDGTTNNPGFDPINRDPSAAVFLPANNESQCDATPSCVAFLPESACTGNTDDDGDGRANDGCAAVGAPETACDGNTDDDNDGVANDGCPAWCAGTSCCCASQCRPYITILLTDGDETCTSFTNTINSTTSLLTTTPRNDFISIASISRTSNVVTITTPSAPTLPHWFKPGDEIFVGGATGYNGTFRVLDTPTDRTLTYQQNGSNTSPTSSGTVRHTASLYRYQVKTIPIGFGIDPGDTEIEAIAHAGGAPDIVGVNEGFYAADETDLELAITQILADSVRSELCNGRDDDCDVTVDEDFPQKTQACSNGQVGVCLRTGTFECRADGTGVQCNAPTVAPGTEGPNCNQLDDDCDGLIDEQLSCQTCVPTGEVCDSNDNDCDGEPDKTCRCSGGTNDGGRCDPDLSQCPGGTCNCTSITRACGVGTCAGTETCVGGVFTGCTATPAVAESCDGMDNDCDGLCDGFQVECSEQVSACTNSNSSCPAVDSLGHSSRNPIPENICRPGVRTCPLNTTCSGTGSSDFLICSGEVKACGPDAPPGQGCDACNGLDDDCDNVIDEDFTTADCSTNCGVGSTSCVNGQITCNSVQAGNDNTCNNQDDDCDGKFDEDWQCPDVAPADGMCDECGAGMVCMGVPKCIQGQVVCQGGAIGNETCNCLDDDCNGTVDDNNGNCPAGSTCVQGDFCQCAFPCAQSEFPCPLGKKCEDFGGGNTFCVNDPCFNVTCPPVNGNLQVCIANPNDAQAPQCVDACSQVTSCPTGFVCFGPAGECRPNNCTTFPDMCTDIESCVNGTCVTNPCQGVVCDSDKYCLGGTCVPSCADVTCPTGQRCLQGVCETDPCGGPCPFGQACNDDTGQCIADPCKVRNCPQGQWCNPNEGICEDDPCVASNITCPNPGEICRGGTCLDPEDLQPDAANEAHVTVGGGGGCSTTGGGSGLLLALGLLLVRRRTYVRPRTIDDTGRRRRSAGGAL